MGGHNKAQVWPHCLSIKLEGYEAKPEWAHTAEGLTVILLLTVAMQPSPAQGLPEASRASPHFQQPVLLSEVGRNSAPGCPGWKAGTEHGGDSAGEALGPAAAAGMAPRRLTTHTMGKTSGGALKEWNRDDVS